MQPFHPSSLPSAIAGWTSSATYSVPQVATLQVLLRYQVMECLIKLLHLVLYRPLNMLVHQGHNYIIYGMHLHRGYESKLYPDVVAIQCALTGYIVFVQYP